MSQMVDSSTISSILAKYDTVLLDTDGVLWETDQVTPIPGIAEAISVLRQRGKRVLFVFNNSMHGRQAFIDKFRNVAGFDASKEDVFGIAYAAAVYLKDVAPIKGRCYLIGEAGLAKELDEAGISHVGFGADPDPPTGNPKELMEMELAQDIRAVLVGFDEHFSYNKLFKAASYLSSPDCMYAATYDIKMFPLAPGRRQPITGSLTAAISAASGRQPTILGKPYHFMLDCIRAKIPGFEVGRTLMVGDSLTSDIAFGNNNGMDSMLVLTGSTKMADLEEAEHSYRPTYIIPSLANIGKWCK